MGDAALSNAEEKIHVKKSSVVADDRRETAFIPTAIVKPKYQKLSFDERQLPIRGEANDASSATITTTPRKVQKHLPKNQKSFAKQNRKLMTTKSGEICSDFNVTDKMAINPNRRGERDIQCSDDSFDQQPRNNTSSVAIVQPIKKVFDIIMNDDEKISVVEKEEIDYSINSEAAMHKKAEPKNKISLPNGSSKMSVCDNENLEKCANREVSVESEDKKVVPTAASKKLQKIHSGN